MTAKTIHEISLECKISVRKLNVLAKKGYLLYEKAPADLSSAFAAKIRYYLGRGRILPVEYLLTLARDPALLDSLGDDAGKAGQQLREMGDIKAKALPSEQAYPMVVGAAVGDPLMLERLAEWIQETIPESGCGYHYLATRMLWNVAQAQFKECYHFITRALVNVRRRPELTECLGPDVGGAMSFRRPLLDL